LARAKSSRARRSANIPPTLSERTAGVSESCRKSILASGMPVERSAGIIIYRDTPEGRRYLLLRASRGESTLASGKNVKEFWDFPKGLLEKRESGIEAARREAEEEAGLGDIEIIQGFKQTVQYFTFRTGKSVPKYVAMFLGRVASRAVTLSWEHDQYSWLGYEDARSRLAIPKMKDALKAAEGFLQKKSAGGRV